MTWPLLASLSSSDMFFLIHYSANLLAVLTLQYATIVPTCKPLNSLFPLPGTLFCIFTSLGPSHYIYFK